VKLTEAEAWNRLAAARVARLATTGANRQPHIVPVTFAVDGDLIYIAIDHKPKTTTNLRRLRNIRENPRVTLLADYYEDDWDRLWWVRVDGDARIIETGEDRQNPLDVLAAKYPQYRQIRPDGPVIAIDARRWTGWTPLADRHIRYIRVVAPCRGAPKLAFGHVNERAQKRFRMRYSGPVCAIGLVGRELRRPRRATSHNLGMAHPEVGFLVCAPVILDRDRHQVQGVGDHVRACFRERHLGP
jgi:PPOX class probable F420-dependent enzyme